jgi:hypothetical protein
MKTKRFSATKRFLAAAGIAAGVAVLSAGAVNGMINKPEPEPLPIGTSLQEYLDLDRKTQAERIFEVQGEILSRFEDDNQIERAICVGEIFADESGLTKLKQINNTIADASKNNIDKTAEEVAEAVITQIYCPEKTYALNK